MTIIKNLLPYHSTLRPADTDNKLSITIHSTANLNSTALNERAWLENPANTRIASWHYCVDENMIIQAIPDNESAYHCSNSRGNKTSLSIEICESGNRKKTLINAAKFVAKKLHEHNLTLLDIKKHQDWVNKVCPRILIDNVYIRDGLDWNWFIKTVHSFYVEDEMTQAEFNNFMDNYLKSRAIKDVSIWAKDTWEKAVNDGITDGTMPQSFATREQVITLISNFINNKK